MDCPRPTKRPWRGLLLAWAGYLLSPLSWWNDPFVNLPIAYAVARLAALLAPALFTPTLLATYWATNVLGFVLLHRGAAHLLAPPRERSWRRWLWEELLLSLLYCALVLLLIRLDLLPRPAG